MSPVEQPDPWGPPPWETPYRPAGEHDPAISGYPTAPQYVTAPEYPTAQQYATAPEYPTAQQYATAPPAQARPVGYGYPDGDTAPWDGHQPYGAPAARRAPAPDECRTCGSAPAADVRFLGHQGIVVLMRFLHADGPFCRDCGLSMFRRMTSRTLVEGWWGVLSVFITPVVVVMNLIRRAAVASLDAPRRDAGVVAPLPAPMHPGRPLLARPAAWLGLAVPVALVGVIGLVGVNLSSPSSLVGTCVRIETPTTARLVGCGERHDGKVTSEVGRSATCPRGVMGHLRLPGDARTLCVSRD